MKLNSLIKTNYSKMRVGRGIGSGKGKTSGRGVKGQKSRSGVAIKSFEGGQMPLYRRLPKRGFKPIVKKNIAIINISDIENFIKNKKIKTQDEINIKNLIEKKLINKKYSRLKILGNGEIKEKLTVKTNFISKSAKSKIEKAGGVISLLKDKSPQNV
ncbi:MAG: 50S ribosomal protein L15 [Candidatus Pelagibacter sp. TMED196]|nr:MAG: 50S ribosomal protein L15 [Candidatus Pelagibacter sp. TMED196]|tara:strand:+ start:1037 stop:1507 length:471 start_codon:yes stop_codon:yes gene_type:complete